MSIRHALSVLLLTALAAGAPRAARADATVGGWGHALSYNPKFLLHNPDGRSFEITYHAFYGVVPGWNKTAVELKLTDPEGKVLLEEAVKLEEGQATIAVPEGPAGVYQLDGRHSCWIETTLERAVLWTGDPQAHAVEGRRAVFQASVPRRWWFYVPRGVTQFTAKAQRADRYMSQREDWGFFIISPRGQRTNALWGQPPKEGPYRQDQTVTVEVEPGAGGRFWALGVQLGDSHNYSNINIALDGVPPYIARSPEAWFNGQTGELPDVKVYDEEPFIQAARKPGMEQMWPNLHHFSPVPSLGDPDSVEVLGDARFALWNPEDRKLGFRIGTYLPRTLRGEPNTADVTITGPDGRTLLDKAMPLEHIHDKDKGPTDTLDTGKGVSFVDVEGAERFFAFTYPATPLVLVGKKTDDGARRFNFSAGIARNWYFFVPEGTKQFAFHARAHHNTDVMHLQVNAPDRTVALVYGNEGGQTVKVPDGLDGKIWHLRPNVGSATQMITTRQQGGRYPDLQLTIDLRGVPGYLAPSWEQWFNPEDPKLPLER